MSIPRAPSPSILAAALVPAALLAACSSQETSSREASSTTASTTASAPQSAPTSAPAWAAPPLERAVSVRDGHTGETLSFEALLDRLADADVVFLGESHTDETTHRMELGVYEGLLARRDGRVVLALEMFERDVQPALDDYLAGGRDEAAFLGLARPWANYATAYRPLVERARAAGAPVVASNYPRPLRQRIGREGREVLEALPADERRQAPAELLANTPDYWRRVDNAIRGHRAAMAGSGGTASAAPTAAQAAAAEDADERLWSTQSLWDNAMGESCALALDAHPGSSVLHVNGGFHSAYGDGTARQLRLRRPGARILTVAIEPVGVPALAQPQGLPEGDYLVYATALATDVSDGSYAVSVPRPASYRFELPAGAASASGGASGASPVPLLLWLGDDGLAAQDGLDLWRERLGGEVALAVLEPTLRETAGDLSPGGRWAWPDSFDTDVGAACAAVAEARDFLLRHYPLDASRVCVAGEGTGAMVAAACALREERLDLRAVALEPRQYVRLKSFPLPLPELRGGLPAPERSLSVRATGEEAGAWWRGELAEYDGVGLETALDTTAADPWTAELRAENAVREALGLPARPAPAAVRDAVRDAATSAAAAGAAATAAGERRCVVVENDSPRARQWARLLASRVARRDGVQVAVLPSLPDDPAIRVVSTDCRSEDYPDDRLPRCPGPFGGTTVLVVPDTQGDWMLRQWSDLKERTRHPWLRVTDSMGLAGVLDELAEQGRQNVLVVPATFCATGDEMRALEHRAASAAARLTLHWLPGLGATAPGTALREPLTADAGTREDTALVYAALLDELTSRGAERLVIQAKPTLGALDGEFSDRMIKGTSVEGDLWPALVAAQAGAQPLTAPIPARLPVTLLSEAETATAIGDWDLAWTPFFTAYPDTTGLIELSAVGFDPLRQRALVRGFLQCGGRCGHGGLYLLEKHDGRWDVVTVLIGENS